MAFVKGLLLDFAALLLEGVALDRQVLEAVGHSADDLLLPLLLFQLLLLLERSLLLLPLAREEVVDELHLSLDEGLDVGALRLA